MTTNRLYEVRKKAGLCVKCGNFKAIKGLLYCLKCREKQKEYQRAYVLRQRGFSVPKLDESENNDDKKPKPETKSKPQKLDDFDDFDEFKKKYVDLKNKHLIAFQKELNELLEKYCL